jgi:transposase
MPSVIATLQATIPELRAVNVDLRATITQEQERVRDLETRVGQHSGNSSRPPSSDLPGTPKRPPSRPSGRGRGGQPGHVAHQRAMAPPGRVDVVTDHWPVQCQACEACLTVLPQAPGLPGVAGAPDFVAHQVTELPVIHPRITEHRLHRLACPSCGTRTRASLPAGVPTGSFGPRVQATVAMLGGRFRLSRRETSGVMGQVFGVPISIGSVDALCQATGEALAPVTAALG